MKLAGAVRREEAAIDWDVEFGDDIDTGHEFRIEDEPADEEEEVEVVLQPPSTVKNKTNPTFASATAANGHAAAPGGGGTGTSTASPSASSAPPSTPSGGVRPAAGPMTLGAKAKSPASFTSSPSSATAGGGGSGGFGGGGGDLGSSGGGTSGMRPSTFYDFPQGGASGSMSMSTSTSTSGSSTFEPPMPRIEIDPRHNEVAPSPYPHYLELRTMSFSLKIICLVHVMMSLFFFLLPGFPWMIFPNVFIAVLGLWGAYKYRASFILLFLLGLVANLVLLIVFMFLDLLWKLVQGPVIVLGFLFVIAELFMIHNSYQFWKKLPSEDFQMYFSQFFSARQAHLGGLVDEEEDL